MCAASLWILPPFHLCISSLKVGQTMQVIDIWVIFHFFMSHFIIANLVNTLPTTHSAAFYDETISFLDHSPYLASLSLLETVPDTFRPVFSSPLCGFLLLFLSFDYWCSLFMFSRTVSSNHHLDSMYLCVYLSVWPFFCVSINIPIHDPQAFPISHVWVKLIFPWVSHLSEWSDPVPMQRPQEPFWLCFLYSPHQSITKTWWGHLTILSLFTVHTTLTLLNTLISYSDY